MTLTGRAALVAAAVWLSAAAPSAEPAKVTVIDHLSVGQQEETIAVYFNGRYAGAVHITPDHPADSFTAAVDDAAQKLTYTLCGRLLRQGPDGQVVTHRIDNSGTLLGDVAGHTLAAMTLGDVLFSLEDTQGGQPSQVQPGPACAAAVS